MRKTTTIKLNREFQWLYRRGKSAVAPTLVVYYSRNRQGLNRLGVTTSTKLGHAVVRNKVRRRIRELYRLHRDELVPARDVLVVARVRAASSSYQTLERDYLRLCKKLGLLRNAEQAGETKGNA